MNSRRFATRVPEVFRALAAYLASWLPVVLIWIGQAALVLLSEGAAVSREAVVIGLFDLLATPLFGAALFMLWRRRAPWREGFLSWSGALFVCLPIAFCCGVVRLAALITFSWTQETGTELSSVPLTLDLVIYVLISLAMALLSVLGIALAQAIPGSLILCWLFPRQGNPPAPRSTEPEIRWHAISRAYIATFAPIALVLGLLLSWLMEVGVALRDGLPDATQFPIWQIPGVAFVWACAIVATFASPFFLLSLATGRLPGWGMALRAWAVAAAIPLSVLAASMMANGSGWSGVTRLMSFPEAWLMFVAPPTLAILAFTPAITRLTKSATSSIVPTPGEAGIAWGDTKSTYWIDRASTLLSHEQATHRLISSSLLGGTVLLGAVSVIATLSFPLIMAVQTAVGTVLPGDVEMLFAAAPLALVGSGAVVLLSCPLLHLGPKTTNITLFVSSLLAMAGIVLAGVPSLGALGKLAWSENSAWLIVPAFAFLSFVLVFLAVFFGSVLLGAFKALAANIRDRHCAALPLSGLNHWIGAVRHSLGLPGFISEMRISRSGISPMFIAALTLSSLLPLSPIAISAIWWPLLRSEQVDGVGWTIEQALFVSGMFVGAALVCANLGNWIGSKARKQAIRLYQGVELRDERRPILYLRAFRQDGYKLSNKGGGTFWRLLPKIGEWETIDEIVLEHGSRIGPVLAIGRPGEPMPPLGAARQYCSDESWQAVVAGLAEASQAIVVSVDSSEGVRWELELIRSRNLVHKTLFLFNPMLNAHDCRKLAADLARLFDDHALDDALDTYLDTEGKPIAYLRSADGSGPSLLLSQWSGRLHYACAVGFGLRRQFASKSGEQAASTV